MLQVGSSRIVVASAIGTLAGLAWASICVAASPADFCRAVETTISAKDLHMPQWPSGSGVRAGWVILEFYVGSDGRAREPRVLHATPAGTFDDAAMRALLLSEYVPATRGGQAVGDWWRFSYLFHTAGYGLSQVTEFEKNVRRNAKRGVASAEYLHSLIVEQGGLRPPKDPRISRRHRVDTTDPVAGRFHGTTGRLVMSPPPRRAIRRVQKVTVAVVPPGVLSSCTFQP